MKPRALGLVALLACGMGQPAAVATSPAHLVVIVLENRSYATVSSNYGDIPFLQSFERGGLRFTNYHEGDTTGPSLPDYLGLAAGSTCGSVDDRVIAGQFGAAQGCRTTVWNQLEGAGTSWAVYMDAMPGPCSSKVSYSNVAKDTPYVMKHNPAVPFASVWGSSVCSEHVLPGVPDAGSLPQVSFAVPGVCDDLHGSSSTRWTDCASGSAGLYHRANDWLSAVVPPLIKAGDTVLIIFDEAGTLYAVEQGPGIAAGTTDGAAYTHYSVLAAIEDAYGLTRLNEAADATPIPLGG
ncbi:MAG: alkaline phosphatase family protein [Actinomycetota bacterium]